MGTTPGSRFRVTGQKSQNPRQMKMPKQEEASRMVEVLAAPQWTGHWRPQKPERRPHGLEKTFTCFHIQRLEAASSGITCSVALWLKLSRLKPRRCFLVNLVLVTCTLSVSVTSGCTALAL